MQYPSKVDCITILSAARELDDDALLPLDPHALGLSRNKMEAAAAFLIERACFKRHSDLEAIMQSAGCRCRANCASNS